MQFDAQELPASETQMIENVITQETLLIRQECFQHKCNLGTETCCSSCSGVCILPFIKKRSIGDLRLAQVDLTSEVCDAWHFFQVGPAKKGRGISTGTGTDGAGMLHTSSSPRKDKRGCLWLVR